MFILNKIQNAEAETINLNRNMSMHKIPFQSSSIFSIGAHYFEGNMGPK